MIPVAILTFPALAPFDGPGLSMTTTIKNRTSPRYRTAKHEIWHVPSLHAFRAVCYASRDDEQGVEFWIPVARVERWELV